MTAEQQAHFARLAAQLWQPPSQVIDVAFEGIGPRSNATAGANSETLFEAASRLGFVGCIDDGPADLSTNPKWKVLAAVATERESTRLSEPT